MKYIKVKYVGWWEKFKYNHYLIHKILTEHYDVEICEDADYIFCSAFSEKWLQEEGIRIFYTGENLSPDFNLIDYAIGFDYLEFGDRYVRVPNWIINPKYERDIKSAIEKINFMREDLKEKNEFCSFVYSNANAEPIREIFFDKLSQYKRVNSGGRFRNNIGEPDGVLDKFEFEHKHKFSIAFENSSQPGYTTEKLIQCFAAWTVPIYWGDPLVAKYFNPKSFINVHDFDSIDDVIKEIKKIDENEELYLDMLRQPVFLDASFMDKKRQELESFLLNIIEQDIEEAKRRNTGAWAKRYETERLELLRAKETVQKVKRTSILGKL